MAMINKELYACSDIEVHVPAHLNFGKFIFDRIRLKKDEIALEHSETKEKLTYAELTQYAVNLSTALSKLGIGRGDTVAVGSEKRNEFLATLIGVLFTGATYTPFDIDSGAVSINYKLELIKPNYLICSNLFWKKYRNKIEVDDIKKILTFDDEIDSVVCLKSLITGDVDVNQFEPAPVQGQTDTAIILYSSGTTGMPKGVLLTHLNCIASSLCKEDPTIKTILTYGEWFHSYDTFTAYKFISGGKKIIYVQDSSIQMFFKIIEDYQIDIVFTVPSIVEQLSKSSHMEAYNLDSLKVIYFGGASLHSKIIEKVKERLPKLKIVQGYGMSEGNTLTSEVWCTKGHKANSVGKVSPGNILKVVDTQTHEVLGPNKPGEIHVRSPTLMKGYVGIDPSLYLDDEGFFKTGDMGYYDDDKYFYIVDRIKDVIAYDCYKFSAVELEAVILEHPGVREVGVVGTPVPIYGEEPIAFVVRNPGDICVTEKELIDLVAAEVPQYMQLRGGVKFIDELPRNSRGKILRRQLRKMLNN